MIMLSWKWRCKSKPKSKSWLKCMTQHQNMWKYILRPRRTSIKLLKTSKSSKQATSNPDDTADAFSNWLYFKIDYNKFLHEDAPAFSRSEIEMINIIWLIEHFDSVKFFRMEGHNIFPSIVPLARSMLPRFPNDWFQEYFFSTTCNFMSAKLYFMDFGDYSMMGSSKDLLKNR